jgi:uncharacterized protein
MDEDQDQNQENEQELRQHSLLPYDEWTEAALRHVIVRALDHVAREGLPDGHHFYLTFRTDHPGVVLPARLRQQYPEEMTIVLQHQFWDLKVDAAAGEFGVGLSFGGVPALLTIPFAAITAFVDPEVRYGLRFRTREPAASVPPAGGALASDAAEAASPETEQPEAAAPQVISLDAFRRRPPAKE